MPTHYEILGVDETATPHAIRAAYLDRMRRVHPDRNPAAPPGPSGISAADLTVAYSTLKDQLRRTSYDAHLARRRYPATGLIRLNPPRRRFRAPAAALYLLWLLGFALLVSNSIDKRADRRTGAQQPEVESVRSLVRHEPGVSPAAAGQ